MWELKEDFADVTRMARYAKKHRAEYAACFANLGCGNQNSGEQLE